ncbi:hypothetical protein SAMN02744102_00892 [Paenibacillus barengoltzii]|nr:MULTISPECIES: hypothetical protein [Paenibacillus]SMF00674.1 hypothetical protein SAMN02744102_00892 [Paenibacillus barengoltzii]
MSYIHQLTEDEVYYICSVIPHKDIIRYFTKNPKEFAKIRPGFRANAISKHDVVNLLFNNRNRRFISLFIDKHIKNWLSQIKDQINRYISEGDNKEEAFLRTLPYSFFFKNVKLYFKLLEEKYSEEYISLLSVAVTSLRDMSKKQELSDNNIKELEIELEKLKADIISKDVELIKCRDELSSTRIAHVESINDQLSVIAELQAGAEEDRNKIDSLQKEKAQLLDKIDQISKALVDANNYIEKLKEQLIIELEEGQKRMDEEQSSVVFSKCPSDMNEFKDYLGYNLSNIGVNYKAEYFTLLIMHLSKTLFYGVPTIVNRATGMNIIKCVSNTLIGKPTVSTLSYRNDITGDKIDRFLQTADRVACLDNFIGNYNETELIPILDKHRDKIIFLTVAYDRTLYYLSKEFMRYFNYLNLNRIGVLSVVTELTEDPSIIQEHRYTAQFERENNRYRNIFRGIVKELGYPHSLIEHFSQSIDNESDLCCVLAFNVLPYCVDVLHINPYNTSDRLLKYAGPDGRCTQKQLLLGWFSQ